MKAEREQQLRQMSDEALALEMKRTNRVGVDVTTLTGEAQAELRDRELIEAEYDRRWS